MTDYQRVLDAVEVVREHLRTDWISEGCKDERVAGCVSCFMLRLDEDLEALVYEIETTLLEKPAA